MPRQKRGVKRRNRQEGKALKEQAAKDKAAAEEAIQTVNATIASIK